MKITDNVASKLYPKIEAIREKINDNVSIPLEWIPFDINHKETSVSISREGLNFDNPTDIEEAIIWMAENGIEIFNAFLPYFEELKY